MSDAPPKPRANRNSVLLPAHMALAIHGVNHGRWGLALLGFVGTLWAARVPYKAARGNTLLYLFGGGGAVLGFVASLFSAPPQGVFPAPVMSSLCGALVGLMVNGAYTGNPIYIRVYAWLLVALSSNVESNLDAFILGFCMCVAELLAVFTHARIYKQGLLGWAMLGLTLLLLVPGTYGMVAFVQFNEGVLMATASRLLREAGMVGGLGLESQVRLAASSSVVPSDRAVLEVVGSVPRLRAVVMDRFDGTTWTRSDALDRQRVPARDPASAPVDITLWPLEDLQGGFLPVPEGTRLLRGEQAGWAGGQVLQGSLLAGVPTSISTDGTHRLPPEPLLDTYLDVPEDLRAELQALAAPVVAGSTGNLEKAHALEAFFRDGFEYAVDTNLNGRGHPLVVLVREHRAAYCSYFASATVLMLRTLGIPARFVGGFIPEAMGLGSRMVVRERDAHAWVEVWDAAAGAFVVLDPTPWRGRTEALGLPSGESLFSRLGSSLRSALLRAWLRIKASPADAAMDVLMSPVGALLAAAFVWILWRNRSPRTRSARVQAAMDTQDAALRRAYARYLAALQKQGLVPPRPSESEGEFLHRMTKTHPTLAAGAAAFVRAYQAARFGGGDRGDVERALSTLEQAS